MDIIKSGLYLVSRATMSLSRGLLFLMLFALAVLIMTAPASNLATYQYLLYSAVGLGWLWLAYKAIADEENVVSNDVLHPIVASQVFITLQSVLGDWNSTLFSVLALIMLLIAFSNIGLVRRVPLNLAVLLEPDDKKAVKMLMDSAKHSSVIRYEFEDYNPNKLSGRSNLSGLFKLSGRSDLSGLFKRSDRSDPSSLFKLSGRRFPNLFNRRGAEKAEANNPNNLSEGREDSETPPSES